MREFLLMQKMSWQHVAVPNPDIHICLMPCTRSGLLFGMGNLSLAVSLFPAGYPALYRALIAINLILCLSAFIWPVF